MECTPQKLRTSIGTTVMNKTKWSMSATSATDQPLCFFVRQLLSRFTFLENALGKRLIRARGYRTTTGKRNAPSSETESWPCGTAETAAELTLWDTSYKGIIIFRDRKYKSVKRPRKGGNTKLPVGAKPVQARRMGVEKWTTYTSIRVGKLEQESKLSGRASGQSRPHECLMPTSRFQKADPKFERVCPDGRVRQGEQSAQEHDKPRVGKDRSPIHPCRWMWVRIRIMTVQTSEGSRSTASSFYRMKSYHFHFQCNMSIIEINDYSLVEFKNFWFRRPFQAELITSAVTSEARRSLTPPSRNGKGRA